MTDNLNLGRPLNHQQGSGASALNASAVPGDLNSSRDTEFAQDVLNSLNGDRQGQQQHSTSGQYSTTNPQSGLQKAGESEPHSGHLHSGSHAHAHFPNESDTLTSGEAGKFGSENDARRQEGFVGASTGSGLSHGHTGTSSTTVRACSAPSDRTPFFLSPFRTHDPRV